MDAPLLVTIVDDDESVRESLPDLVRLFGFSAQAFESAEAFLASGVVDKTRCLILDVAMPGMSGPDLQRELKSWGMSIPIIFISAVPENFPPSLMDDGAAQCLLKPFSDTALLSALTAVFEKNGL